MRLVVLSYRLTKIKGVLVSAGICALTNATMFISGAAGAAGLSLALATSAHAQSMPPPPTPGCNTGSGTISGSISAAQFWTSPSTCVVASGAALQTTNADALTTNGNNLPHSSLANNGYLHASLTGTALSNTTIAAFSNLVNVGSISNNEGATIQGDYQGSITLGDSALHAFNLSGTGNNFEIYGVNNQATGSIASFNNDGSIVGTIDSGIDPNTVSYGLVVALNNAGSIGSLNNSTIGVITAGLGEGVYRTDNYLNVIAVANSNYIGTLTNSGYIGANDLAILNGSPFEFSGPPNLQNTSATIGQLVNSGFIGAGSVVIANAGHFDTITNYGTLGAGFAAIEQAPNASIDTLNNFGQISAGNVGVLNIAGTITNLNNSGALFSNDVGVVNVNYVTYDGESVTGTLYGTITNLTNSGYIGGGFAGVYNQGWIANLTNESYDSGEGIAFGTIDGGQFGILNDVGQIGTLTNQAGAVITGGSVGLLNGDGYIQTITNAGLIAGELSGVQNYGGIDYISNASTAVITSDASAAFANHGSIGTLSNDGLIHGTNNNYAVLNDGYIETLSNSATGSIISDGAGSISSGTAIENEGSIGTLTNAGLIQASGSGTGIYNEGSVDTLTNSGSIGGGWYGISNETYEGSDGYIGSLSNSGSISGEYTGIYNSGRIDALTNSGTISGYSHGIQNSEGTIESLSNSGLIESYYYGIDNSGSIGTLGNSGTISSSSDGIYNSGHINALSNSGSIDAYYRGIYNSGGIDSIANSGSISAYYYGIENDTSGSIGSIGNSAGGTIAGSYSGIYNLGYIGTVTNNGLLTGYYSGIDNYHDGSIFGTIGEIWNQSGGTIEGYYALTNYGQIGSLLNDGKITGISTGLYNEGSIGTLTNTGQITGGSTGVYNYEGVIDSVTNSGVIAGEYYGVDNEASSIGTLWNTSGGSISGEYAVYNDGVISTLVNDGRITSPSEQAIYNDGTIGTLANTGLISGGQSGVYNDGVIDVLYNNGMIQATDDLSGTMGYSYGVANEYVLNTLMNDSHGTIMGNVGVVNWDQLGTLDNAGVILGSEYGIENDGSIGTLANIGNTGVIIGDYALYNNSNATIDSVVNSGNISGRSYGIVNYGSISTLANSGQITGEYEGMYTDGVIDSLTNEGTISGASAGVFNDGSIGSLTNSGTLAATGETGGGIWNRAVIDSLTNSGHISGASAGVSNYGGSIGTFTNSGTIQGTGAGEVGDGVYNAGSISTLANSGSIEGVRAGVYNELNGIEPGVVGVQGLTLNPQSPSSISLIDSLSNTSTGTISGTVAGVYNAGGIVTLDNAGLVTGAAGVSNSGMMEELVNSGTISGTDGDAIYTSGGIGSVSNSGLLSGTQFALNVDEGGTVGGLSNSGVMSAPTAINVAETGSLGPVSNTGTIAGNIINASANDLSITGGSGTVVGLFTGYHGGIGADDIGTISNTAANVTFAGNVLLNDHVDVGSGTVSNSGTLQVNNPINITGDYAQSAAGTLVVGVAGVDNHGELNVSSGATVDAGGHVVLTRLAGFRFAAGEKFTLINADSATYNTDSMTASATGFSGGYLINEVQVDGQTELVVCLTNRVTQNCSGNAVAYSVATTSNAVTANDAAGRYPGSSVALNRLADAVVALTDTPTANRAGNQLLAAPHHESAQMAQQPALDVLNVVSDHADRTRLALNGEQSGVAAGESHSGVAVWGEGFGGDAHRSQDGQFSGYGVSSAGLVAGIDVGIADSKLRLGGAFNYTHANLKEHGDRTGDSMGLDAYGVLAYGSYIGDRAYADLVGGVMFDKFDTTRVIDFPGFVGVATGEHDGTQVVAKLTGGYRVPMGADAATTLTPVWGVSYGHLKQDAYTETGGNGAALSVDSASNNSLKGEAGLKLERSYAVTRGTVVPEVKLLYRHEFENGTPLQSASFAADETGYTFSTQNAKQVENSGVFSAGINFLGKTGATVTLKYSAEVASGYVSQGGSLRVRWAF